MHIGIDTGGTFTDLVCAENGSVRAVLKVPSTPHDPSKAVLAGLRKLLESTLIDPATVARIVHGTTVATNAVLERKGARTGVITTHGFRDVLEIGRQIRTAVYDLQLQAETPVFLAPGSRRVEVLERVSADGSILVELDESSVLQCLRTLVEQGVQAVAVSLLFAFLNPAHERRIRALAEQHYPDLVVSLSSEVDPAFREYERTVVTAFDAYTKPVLSRYLQRIQGEFVSLGLQCPFQVMQSRGGIADARIAMERPVRLFLSGPAAGVIGGAATGQATGHPDLLTVDVGGTSCDIALIAGNKPLVRPVGLIDGYPVRVPMVDVNAIGAGGGSIAWLDEAKGLRVGPQSAGANPGPACYGLGSTVATVTDASLVLGLLNPDNFAGGSMRLDIELARAAIAETVAAPLGLSVEQAALGIHRVVNAQMAEGMRLVSIKQGYDPRQFALVALGGAGPVHAVALAEELHLERIIIPRYPGVLSAAGLLAAPIEHEAAVGYPCDLADVELSELSAQLESLNQQCAALMARESTEDNAITRSYRADICYVGQSHYLEVELDLGAPDTVAAVYKEFLRNHDRVFGYSTDAPARIVNLRVLQRSEVPVGAADDAALTSSASATPSLTITPAQYRDVIFDDPQQAQHCPIYDRALFSYAQQVHGPAIIEQADTTVVLPKGWCAAVAADNNLVVQRTVTAESGACKTQ
jgi:N-methylhydantoinase A/oxoprolinase/acetone carboxylase beta subunit